MSDKDLYVGWLKDAYSMETTLISALEDHARDARDFPELRGGLEQHLQQTRRHADLVKSCLERHGESASGLKTGLSGLAGQLKNMMNAAAADEVVKNTLDDFVAEHLEIASYTALIAAAEQLGDQQTATICRQILQEEQEAARIVITQIPVVTQTALRKKATAGTR
jgi:ferritin-like metal-binding protein YciE